MTNQNFTFDIPSDLETNQHTKHKIVFRQDNLHFRLCLAALLADFFTHKEGTHLTLINKEGAWDCRAHRPAGYIIHEESTVSGKNLGILTLWRLFSYWVWKNSPSPPRTMLPIVNIFPCLFQHWLWGGGTCILKLSLEFWQLCLVSDFWEVFRPIMTLASQLLLPLIVEN